MLNDLHSYACRQVNFLTALEECSRKTEVYILDIFSKEAEGVGVLVLADGSFYRGNFHHNQAEDHKGVYVSALTTYEGGFRNNRFEGKCVERRRITSLRDLLEWGEREGSVEVGCR